MVARLDPRKLAEILTLHDKVRRSYARQLTWHLACMANHVNPEVFPVPGEHRRPPMSHTTNMYHMSYRLARLTHLDIPLSATLYEIGRVLFAVETKLLNIPDADIEEIDFV